MLIDAYPYSIDISTNLISTERKGKTKKESFTIYKWIGVWQMGNCFKLSKVANQMRGYSYDASRCSPFLYLSFILSHSLSVCLFVIFRCICALARAGARERVGINLRLSISIITFEVSFK